MTKISYDGAPQVPAYWTAVRSQEQLDSMGFMEVHDTIVRVLKSNLPIVTVGKKIDLFDAEGQQVGAVRHAENGITPINPEWVLGCKAIL